MKDALASIKTRGEAEMYGFHSNNEPKPGEPIFMFVSRIPDADRDKALAEAF